MQVYEVVVVGRSVLPNGGDTTLVRTSVGVDSIHVLFDSSEWLDFGVIATFANGDNAVSKSVTLTSVDSDDYAAEATCEIPWEVLQEVGDIEVTFSGTKQDGDYIITEASEAILTVVQEGVNDASDPSPEPTISEWEQAYADAMAAANDAASVVANLEAEIDSIVSQAEGEIDAKIAEIVVQEVGIATTEEAGVVMPDGVTISVDENGVITATVEGGGMTPSQANALANLQRLAAYAFESVFDDESGHLVSAVTRQQALPIATSTQRGTVQPDGESLEVGDGGTLSVKQSYVQAIIATLDGALKYKGEVESVEDLDDIESPSIGDLYMVGDVSYFWNGEDWAVVSPDLSPYELSANLSPITPAEVHQITQQAGPWAGEYYVTQASLDASLNTHTQFIESYLDEQLEAILNGSY